MKNLLVGLLLIVAPATHALSNGGGIVSAALSVEGSTISPAGLSVTGLPANSLVFTRAGGALTALSTFSYLQNGRVGIGRSDPLTALHVQNDGGGDTVRIYGTASNSPGIVFGNVTTGILGNFLSGNSGQSILYTGVGGGNLTQYWGPTGLVGIGTADPCSTCTHHVKGNASVTGNFSVDSGTAAIGHATGSYPSTAGRFVVQQKTPYSSIGDGIAMGVIDQAGAVGTRTQIGIGYPGANDTQKSVVVIGARTTSSSGGGMAAFFVANRETTTATTAPVEHFTVTEAGNVGASSTTWHGTPVGTGTCLYRCSGGTFAGNIVYGGDGLCTGGTAVITPICIP